MKLVPLADRVVLKQLEAEETTKSGIVLPGAEKEKPQQAEVIAVGPGGVVDGKEVKMEVKKGDNVIYSKYSGTEVKLDDVTYIIVKQNDIGLSRIIKPLLHLTIIRCWLMPGVQNENPEIEAIQIGKIRFHQFVPSFLLRLGDLGISISWQIHKIKLLINKEIIHMNRFAWNRADTRKVFPVQKFVDYGRFSDIGFSGKHNTDLFIMEKLVRLCHGSHKFNVIKIDQIITSITEKDVWTSCFSTVPGSPRFCCFVFSMSAKQYPEYCQHDWRE